MNQYGSPQVWKKFTGLYELLPLAAIVDKDKFCCHGGLSPSFSTVDEIMTFERGPDIPHDGGLCDLMWSDPNAEEESKSRLLLTFQRTGRCLLEERATTSAIKSRKASSTVTSCSVSSGPTNSAQKAAT